MMMIISIKAMQGRQGVGGYACDKGDIVIIIIPIIVKVRPRSRIIIHACNSGQGAGGDASNKGEIVIIIIFMYSPMDDNPCLQFRAGRWRDASNKGEMSP